MRYVLALALVALLSPAASADIVGTFTSVAGEAGTTPPAGFVTQDLIATAPTDWLAANLIVDLTQGSFLQQAIVSGFGPPSSALVAALPETRWDTYVTTGKGIDAGAPSSAGGAVDLGGSATAAFTASQINLNWFTTATDDIGTFSLGRFTLSNNAEGSFKLRLDALGQAIPTVLHGVIHNGVITAVPEPTSLLLLACGSLGLIALHRRRAAA